MSIVQRARGKVRFAFKDPLKDLGKNPNKDSLIMLHFSYGKMRLKYSTGYYSCYTDWDYSKQRLRNKAHIVNRGLVNDLLNTLETELYKEISSLESKQEAINKDVLRQKLDEVTHRGLPQEEDTESLNIFKYIDEFLTLRNGKLKKITIRAYKQTRRILEQYNSKLSFDDIDLNFYYDFINYLEDDDYKANTVGKHIKNLKSILRSATEDGINKNMAYTRREFKVLREQTTAVYLDEEELKKIAKYDFSAFPNLDHARDIFLIGCYTGQRISDYNGLTENHFYQTEGVKFFRIRQKKTKKEVLCPITVEIQEILSKPKNNNIPPKKMNEQDINEYIKEVGRKVGITQKVTNRYTKGGIEKADVILKYEMISTHTARRSFCTNMYKKGMPIFDIMHFSGHSSEKEFYNYIRIEKEQKAIKLAKSSYFNL